MENNTLSNLAVAVTLEKRLKEFTSPRGGAHGAPTARTDADDALRELYQDQGVTQQTIFVNDQKVGTLSVKLTKAKHEFVPEIADTVAFAHWVHDNADDVLDALFEQNKDALLKAATDGGVLPDGVVVREVDIPSGWAGTTLRVKDQDVVNALGTQLPETVSKLLLGDGSNG